MSSIFSSKSKERQSLQNSSKMYSFYQNKTNTKSRNKNTLIINSYKDYFPSIQRDQYSFKKMGLFYNKYIIKDKPTLTEKNCLKNKSNSHIKKNNKSSKKNYIQHDNKNILMSNINSKINKNKNKTIFIEEQERNKKRIKKVTLKKDSLNVKQTNEKSITEKNKIYRRNTTINKSKKNNQLTYKYNNKLTKKIYLNNSSKRNITPISTMSPEMQSKSSYFKSFNIKLNCTSYRKNLSNDHKIRRNTINNIKIDHNTNIHRTIYIKNKDDFPFEYNVRFNQENKKNNIIKIMHNPKNNIKTTKNMDEKTNLNNNKIIKKVKKNDNETKKNKLTKIKHVNKIPALTQGSIINLMNNDSCLNQGENRFKKDIRDNGENINIINDIKINQFEVKKPKEKNLKYTLFEQENNRENTEMKKSKIFIGQIDEYKDIIENDKLNTEFFSKEKPINILEFSIKENNSIIKKNKNVISNYYLRETKELKGKIHKNISEELSDYYNSKIGFSEREIKSILNYVDNGNGVNEFSASTLKSSVIFKNLLPYHVNNISFVKKYDDKLKKDIFKVIMSNKSILLINKSKLNLKYQYEIMTKIIRTSKTEDLLKNINKYNNKNFVNNIKQNTCNISFGIKDKKCIIF